jgi:hypothetical protein
MYIKTLIRKIYCLLNVSLFSGFDMIYFYMRLIDNKEAEFRGHYILYH